MNDSMLRMDDLMLQSGVAVGKIRHRRHLPKPHQFAYPQWMVWLDLDDIPEHLQQPSWWQRLCRAGLRFERQDYLLPHSKPMAELVRQQVLEHSGEVIDGKIFLLGHLRQWGYCFNPVVFYFCYDKQGILRAIVAEITNTPWGERHRYVLMADELDQGCKSHKFMFSKEFHVSPFMPMQLNYEWTFTFYRSRIGIFMVLNRAGERVFDASLELQMKSFAQLGQMPWRFPLQSQRVSFGIYWQALLLRLKRLRVFPHPERAKQPKP